MQTDTVPQWNHGGCQRTDTHDDVHDGMVVDSGSSVAENCNCQFLRHFPHLPHVLVIDEIVEFWDEFGSETHCKKAHGKPSRHGRCDPLEAHLLPCPDLLEWTNKSSLFDK